MTRPEEPEDISEILHVLNDPNTHDFFTEQELKFESRFENPEWQELERRLRDPNLTDAEYLELDEKQLEIEADLLYGKDGDIPDLDELAKHTVFKPATAQNKQEP